MRELKKPGCARKLFSIFDNEPDNQPAMKKFCLFLTVILFWGSTGTSAAQEIRTLSHGFSINLVIGIPSTSYAYAKAINVNDDNRFLFTSGLQIGNRWYFGYSRVFKMGLMVNWFDFTTGYRKNNDLTRIAIDASLFEFGPIGSFGLSDDIALDLYYNLRPTAFAHFWTYPAEDPEGYLGGGFSHAAGTAFRWRALNVGLEYVLGSINCEYLDSEAGYADQKLRLNSLRLMIGAKF